MFELSKINIKPESQSKQLIIKLGSQRLLNILGKFLIEIHKALLWKKYSFNSGFFLFQNNEKVVLVVARKKIAAQSTVIRGSDETDSPIPGPQSHTGVKVGGIYFAINFGADLEK